jgi:pimeloyl-ACP methyl ester carboxylesterase
VDGHETYYWTQGAGEPILLLHGWGSSGESFAGVAEALEDEFALHAVDLPGFGWSAPPPAAWASSDYAAHVDRFMEVAGLPSAHVLGHSFGGRVAIGLAARFPQRVRKLVLVASAGIRPGRTAGYYFRVAVAKAAGRAFSPALWGRRGERLREAAIARVGSRDYLRAGRLRPTFVKVVNEDVRPCLPRIEAPTLIVWGSADREIPEAAARIMARGIRGARLEILDGAGHFPFLERPDQFAGLVRAFLRGEVVAWR